MPRHSNLPFHIYVNVQNSALGPTMPAGVTKGIWHASYCRPSQIMQAHVLLETGANWSGLTLHDLSTSNLFPLECNDLQPWGGMGDELEIVHMHYLEGLPCTGSGSKAQFTGRHTGLVFDWADGFSRYPAEHKPLNLIELDHGQFALLPNNYVKYFDKHFTSPAKQAQLALYRRGETVHWER